jgi:hypothetical protein
VSSPRWEGARPYPVASIWFENWGSWVPVSSLYCVKDLKTHPPRPPLQNLGVTTTNPPRSKIDAYNPIPQYVELSRTPRVLMHDSLSIIQICHRLTISAGDQRSGAVTSGEGVGPKTSSSFCTTSMSTLKSSGGFDPLPSPTHPPWPRACWNPLSRNQIMMLILV